MGAQNQPLPDQETFLKETRKHLQTDTSVQSSYMYVETRREVKLDKDGRTAEESVKVSESYPGLPGQPRWERSHFEGRQTRIRRGSGGTGS